MNAEIILQCTKKIIESQHVAPSKARQTFLDYIVRETLTGRESNIKAYTIAVEALGKSADFDPQKNPYIRVQANRLRKALDDYYKTEGVNDPIRIELPRGRYIPSFISTTQMNGLHQGNTQQPAAVDKTLLMVMPFSHDTHEKEQVQLAADVEAGLRNVLARFDDFPVSFQTDSDLKISENNIFKVTKDQSLFLLTGHIHHTSAEVQVKVALHDTQTRKQVWHATFPESTSNSSFSERITTAIAASIGGFSGILAQEMKSNFPGINPTPMERDALLKYFEAFKIIPTKEYFDEVIADFKTALESGRNKSLFQALIAETYLTSVLFGFYDFAEVQPDIRNYLSLAALANPENQFIKFIQGFYNYLAGFTDTAVSSFEACVAHNPNDAFYLGICGFGIALTGEFERGLAMLEKSREFNPYFLKYNFFPYCLYCFWQGEFAKSLEVIEQLYIPELLWSHLLRLVALVNLDRMDEASVDYTSICKIMDNNHDRVMRTIDALIVPDDLRKVFKTAYQAAAAS